MFVEDTDTLNDILEKVQANGAPRCPGYDFDGWYLTSMQGDVNEDVVFQYDRTTGQFSFGTHGLLNEKYDNDLLVDGRLTYNPTLYAHWTKTTKANYTTTS